MKNTTLLSALCILFVSAAACDDKKAPPPAEKPAPAPTPTPTKEPAPVEPAKPSRPEKIDTAITADKRGKVESAVPESKGFLLATELEEKLKANKKLKEKTAGVTAFDKMAQSKWVLFT